MSALPFKLLLYLCVFIAISTIYDPANIYFMGSKMKIIKTANGVTNLYISLALMVRVWSNILLAYGIQNHRYPTRFDNNHLRLGKRQDFFTKSRFFMWKPALSSGQIYPNVKTPAIPINFNRYGIPPPPMAPIHQNYMFAIPTKVNYPSYQPVKEIDDKRKPGNLHHITIINAIMPKPYLPTVPTHSHPTTTFRNYRPNNKLLYHQYFNNNNFGRQNMDNLNKINAQQLQLQQLQQQQQHLQMVYPSSPLALQINTPTMEYRNVINYNGKSNNNMKHEENEINTQVSQCGRKAKNDSTHSASDVLYYYCNNRITNYKNPTQQQSVVSIQPTTTTSTSTSTTTTTTTTTEAPPTTSTQHSTKSLRSDFNFFTTERPIFLPTPNSPMENIFTPITSTSILKNSIVDPDTDNNFKQQRQKYRTKKYEDIRPQQQRHRQTATRYEDIKRQHQYTTAAAAAASYDDMKLHSFFTIEDAVTRAPEMQVFNDPYQAYRHARRHHHSHQRQITTSTKKPDTTPTTKKMKFKSFFDDLEEDDYTIPEVHQYDYTLFSTPPKSVYHKSEFHNELKFPEHNQILDHTHKPTEDNAFFAVDETYLGKPKIKEHHFGLFKAIGSTTYSTPAVTTYKPYDNLRNLILTTHKIPNSSSYDSKPITFTTTTTTTAETALRSHETITERENTTSGMFSNEVRTSTIIPITTTTEKKYNRIVLKSPLNLRSPTTFKYPKHSRIHKSYKNSTSTTTRVTPTLKKAPKYQRQYKTKKLKQFKHLFTTSSSTTSTTTTAIPTTIVTPTKRMRIVPTTSTTEEPTTKKALIIRTFSTTEATRVKKLRQHPHQTPETTNRKKIKSRTSTASTIVGVNDNTTRRQSPRRGSKRANIIKSEKENEPSPTRKTENKNRRRLTTSSSTVKPGIATKLSSTSTTSPAPTSSSLRTSTTTTTMKSIMRIANSKSRGKLHNEVKSPVKTSIEVKDDRQIFDERMPLRYITSTMASIPPLPIEIYFKKSHSAKL